MNKTTEALKLAEEALASIAFEKPSPVTVESLADIAFKALRAIREALAEPVKQEPVAWVADGQVFTNKNFVSVDIAIPLYTAPVQPVQQELVCKTCESLARTVMMDQTGKA